LSASASPRRYTSLGARGVEHALAESGAAAVVTDAAGARLMSSTQAAADAARVVLLPPRGADDAATDADAAEAKAALPAGKPVHTFRELLSAGQAAGVEARKAPADKDTALLMFTSGSTGTPKARDASLPASGMPMLCFLQRLPAR
jgi:long-subunit acyl-CoA synthetase (AMP-forming)